MLKKIRNKLKKCDQFYRARIKYTKFYENLDIDNNVILLEAQHGDGIMGNIFYIAKELATNSEYGNFKIYVSVRGRKLRKVKNFFDSHNIKNINVIMLASETFFEILATAKFIITDTALTPNYIKKDGQILINTWHGTPLKTLGKQVKSEPQNISNIQKNFIQSDYLLYPNEYMKKHMIEDYMLENICGAKTIMCGYPRNTIFFDEESRNMIKEELNIQDKEVIVYMPTWRGTVSKVDDLTNNIYTMYYLMEIDKKLKENQIMYVQLHPFVKNKIGFKMFKNVKSIPSKYETYEFLNIADCLITDYSSVFFDFAITRKKIILFTYDKEQYLTDRGMYLNIDELPFPQVDNIESLIKEINTSKGYNDIEFLNAFCKYESKDATRLLCERVILNKKNGLEEEKIANNGKENILMYVGDLAKNGITTSMKNLLQNVDTDKYNYFITFIAKKVAKNKDILLNLPKGVNYISTSGPMNAKISEKILIKLFEKKVLPSKSFMKIMKKVFEREIKRVYYNIKFSNVIQFNGYESKKILQFSCFDSKRSIFVHNDMDNEIKTKGNQRRDVLKYAYQNYDNVIVVTDDLIESTKKFTNNCTDKIKVINNAINYMEIKEKSLMEVELDVDTALNIEYDRLVEILSNDSKKFINIGRFSPEKGQIRLIECFERLWNENKDIYLIIIGGNGKDYNKICNKVNEMESKDNIILIKSISNPYPILNKCDYFVLSSFYEGFGIVIAEADILGKPVISTNIVGPKNFMRKYNGLLVEDSHDGILDGMNKLLKGQVGIMNVDFEQYNKKIKEDFEKLMENRI